MKNILSERGYTLILTLIVVTLLFLFLSSFTISAMNQNKQVEQTDDTYEVTAIAEMGAEYYQVKVNTEILNAFQEVKNIIADSSINNDVKLNKISDRYNKLISNITSLNLYNPISLDPSKGFSLLSSNPPKITEKDDKSILEIEVEGKIDNKKQIIAVKFNIPTSLVTTSTGTSGSGMYNSIVIPPTFPNTDSTGINTCPSTSSTTGSSDSEFICKSSVLDNLGNILNLNLYYTGPIQLNEINENFRNLNNFYANSSVKITNLKPKEKSSFYMNGSAVIDSIDNPKNTTLYAQDTVEINSINKMNSLTIYSNNKVTFQNAIQAKNLTLYAKELSFNNLNNENSNLNIQVDGNAIFNGEIGSIKDSYIVINGTATFNNQNQATIKGNSILLLDSIKFKNTNNNNLRLEDNSKVCIRNVDYEDVKHTIQGTKDTKLIMMVTNPNDVKTTGHEEWVLESDFNSKCNIGGTSLIPNTPDTTDFVSDIIYK